MCVDSRVPIKKDEKWVYETDCGYNPNIAKWSVEE